MLTWMIAVSGAQANEVSASDAVGAKINESVKVFKIHRVLLCQRLCNLQVH